ncbi:cupin domain-containing protein [Actinomadura madurae]|uniref:cupin domain-containing protein n=1 Tax=Actinomadura madurae TaxID=1993 RepID=UPI000D8B3667|nr:cupin domain-containing protein [Actinomadura madurae]SPT51238.1 Uncharacterized conserved protein, contains double-stranded beta-helix domain [Actinomadura madurae]
MDIRNDKTARVFIEHEGTVKVTSFVPKFTMREETAGGFLELVDRFEIAAGGKAAPHYHDTHEFYYILDGDPVVQIENEAHRVYPGELVHIPRNARHSVWPTGDKGMAGLCFAISYQEPYEPGYVPCDLPEVEVTERDS